jgi:hypothetical protein
MARPLLAFAAALALALAIASSADAATTLGSADPDGPPDAYACASCPAGATVGFRQFALQRAVVEAPEAGVIVAVRAYVKRIAGTAQPMIAVLAPGEGIAATVTATAPLPAPSPAGALVEVRDLHLPIQAGGEIGILLPVGQADLGIRMRTRPDGGVVSFAPPCNTPCGMSAGTGVELLLAGTVEPDFDEDLLGDETQDPDRGGLEDEAFGDDEAEFEEEDDFGRDRRRRRRVQLVRIQRHPDGGATLVLATPRAGRLVATAKARRRVMATGKARARRAGRVRLRLRPRRTLARPVRTRLKVKFRGRQALARPLTLRRST